MNKVIAVIDFTGHSAPDLGGMATIIHKKMTENAATFPQPTVSMTVLGEQIADLQEKIRRRMSRATPDVLALRLARQALARSLRTLGIYVNSVALGDAAVVERSGFPSYSTLRVPNDRPPPAPENLRLKHGKLSGTVVARYKPGRVPSVNEVQVCLTDPGVESAWVTWGMFPGGKAELKGLTPGAVLWVRVRTVGLKGVMGAWSDPAQIRVL